MRIITRNSDNVVVMYSPDGQPTPDPGTQTAHDLNESEYAAFVNVMEMPNSGVIYDGTTFLIMPPAPPPPVVARCTPWQFRKEMRILNIKTDVEALIAQQDEETREAYDYCTEIESDNPLLITLAGMLNPPISEQQLYDMILSASTRKIGGP